MPLSCYLVPLYLSPSLIAYHVIHSAFSLRAVFAPRDLISRAPSGKAKNCWVQVISHVFLAKRWFLGCASFLEIRFRRAGNLSEILSEIWSPKTLSIYPKAIFFLNWEKATFWRILPIVTSTLVQPEIADFLYRLSVGIESHTSQKVLRFDQPMIVF